MTPSCMLGIQLTLFAHLTHLSEVEYTLVYTKHLLGVSKQGKRNTVSYFYINIFKFLKILSSFFPPISQACQPYFPPGRVGWEEGEGYLSQICLVCASGLSESLPYYSQFCGPLQTLLQSLFGNCNVCNPNLVTFHLCINHVKHLNLINPKIN